MMEREMDAGDKRGNTVSGAGGVVDRWRGTAVFYLHVKLPYIYSLNKTA
jgi:hypothetical protein